MPRCLVAALHVKPVEDAMCDRRENDAGDENNRQATVKRIQTGKELAAKGDRCIHGTHSAQEHRRIQKGINPAQSLKNAVADHPGKKRNSDECKCDDPAVSQPDNELVRRNYRLSAMLKVREQIFHWR